MIYILLVCLLMLLILSYKIFGNDVVSPSFLFVSSFVFCVGWATAFAKKWTLVLHMNTFLTIFLGTILFIFVSFIIDFFYKITDENKTKEKLNLKYISIEKWKLFLFIIFEIISVWYTVRELKNLTGINSLNDAISFYRNATATGKYDYSFPQIMVIMRLVSNAAGYWFIYVFANNLIVLKKIEFMPIIIIFLSAFSNVLLGGRGNAINVVIAFVVIFYFLYREQYQITGSLNFKIIIPILLLMIGALVLFQSFGAMLGRTSDTGSLDYLAKYCGAEIKNLDTFLQSNNFPVHSNYWGSQTFINVIKSWGKYFGLTDVSYTLNLPFLQVNGFNLGNVYTTFYPYIYDFGYLGIAILVPVMASMLQIVYNISKKMNNYLFPNLSLVTYGYMASSIVLSFFSNKFYEQNFSSIFVMNVILWIMFNLFFCKIKFFDKSVKKNKNI